MIVVDASAAVLALLDKGDARRHLSTNRLSAPHLVDAEVLQTMRKLVLRGTLSDDHAEQSVERWRRLEVQRFALVGFAPRIWALRHDISAYDACYVSLAEALECPLLTADARIAAAPGPVCPIIVLRG
ncbi:MAG: type II toxin-antitoxin system VapC family toxin [bacterium]|nr:type II toxin-antitoxin system VapC family toxin [bacterium]MDE0290109.1 type II toxin-antitoxin system VapC family toxin [bacterium]MDE0438983.1 type II toxin-antitoxin system VapC family toxin [bacterium]